MSDTVFNYSGSLLNFDVLDAASSSQYFQDFQLQLQNLGFTAERMAGRGNRLRVTYQGQSAFLYFQGAGTVHWWAFQKAVAANLVQEAEGCPVYLVAGGLFGGKARYLIKEATAKEYPQGISGRESISGDAPRGFQPLEKWEDLLTWHS